MSLHWLLLIFILVFTNRCDFFSFDVTTRNQEVFLVDTTRKGGDTTRFLVITPAFHLLYSEFMVNEPFNSQDRIVNSPLLLLHISL